MLNKKKAWELTRMRLVLKQIIPHNIRKQNDPSKLDIKNVAHL